MQNDQALPNLNDALAGNQHGASRQRDRPLSKRLDFISISRKHWRNATHNQCVRPTLTFQPSTKDDLIEIIQDAESRGLRVRAVGAGHSFSAAAVPAVADYFVEMFKISDCGSYEAALKPGMINRYFVKAQAGVRIKCLNKKLFKMGLALDNMGAFDWQTISGALSTGTHGTGIKQPAFPDMVRAVILIGSGGKVMHIEPADGITNPTDFHRFEQNEGIELIQDDDVFYSVVLSLGAMGLIYELVLEVSPKYWIKETRSILDWETELKPKLLNGYFQKMVEERYDFVSFRINPYKTFSRTLGREVQLCALAVQKKYPWNQRPPERSWSARTKNMLNTIFGNMGIFSWLVVRWLNMRPQAIPQSINSVIKGTRDKLFVGHSYKVLYRTGLSIRKHGISSEFSFPVDYQRLVELVEGACAHLGDCQKTHNLYQTSYIPVRFVPQSKAYLSPCFTGPKMFMDFPTLEDVKGCEDLMERTQLHIIGDLTLKKTAEELGSGGVPHWGKINSHIYNQPGFIHAHYPMAKRWIEIRNQLDPKGTFLSEFIMKMGLS